MFITNYVTMRKVVFLLAFLQISLCFAQRPNGERRVNGNAGQRNTTQERPKFEASKTAGIFEYSSKKVLKNLKIKKGDSIADSIAKYIEKYNNQISTLEKTNRDLLEGLDIVVNQNMEAAMKNRNRELMRETMMMVQDKLQPIRMNIKAYEDVLNSSLLVLFDEVQNEKWLSYQKNIKEKLKPKRRQGNDARNKPDSPNNSRRRRG